MSQKKTINLWVVSAVLCVSLFRWATNANERSKIEREAAPYLGQYRVFNSPEYQGILAAEGFVYGYQGDLGSIIQTAAEQYAFGTGLDYRIDSLIKRWKAADSGARNARMVSALSAIVLVGTLVFRNMQKPRARETAST